MDKKTKTKSKKKGFFSKYAPKKIVKALWIAFGGVIALITVIFALISLGVIGYMPNVEDLENPIDKYASQVYSSDGKQLGTYSQAKNNRIFSDYSDLSPYLVEALVATEDARYYEHSGIDAYALARAIIKRGLLFDKNAG
jgi:penicillin-binding protein 1A